MKPINKARVYKGPRAALYFAYFTDKELQDIIVACQQELELRSQESMVVEEQDGH